MLIADQKPSILSQVYYIRPKIKYIKYKILYM